MTDGKKYIIIKSLKNEKGRFMENIKKIAITTDSNSGVLPNEYKDKNVFVLPMPFIINGGQYFENVNLTQAQFYDFMKNNASVSTSQPSPGDLLDFWEDLLKEYDEIVHIPMTSGLSQACNSATRFAKEYGGRIQVVDNKRISVVLKESILDAIELVKQGKSALEIKQVLEENALDFAIYISVNEMKYLKKGGRITGAAAMIGTLLGLKPVLKLGGEKIDKFALPKSQRKAKEVIKEAIRKDIDSKFKQYEENGELVISVAYTDNKEIAEELKQDLIATFPKLTFGFCEPLSLSVSCHVGPGTIGVAIVRSLVKKNS